MRFSLKNGRFRLRNENFKISRYTALLHHIDLIDKDGTKTSNFYILDMSIYLNLTADRKLE